MEKILYVDDEDMNLQLFRLNFRGNYEVITTSRPMEAIDIIENHSIKVVVTDYKMPLLNGMELIEKIKVSNPEVICIMLSGYLESDVVTDKSKVFRYIMKPFNRAEFLLTMEAAFSA